MTNAAAWADRRHILCVRLDNLGDVLMTTPALRALKAQQPGRRLTLLTSHMGSEIAALIPEVDEVIEFDVPWVKLNGAGPDGAAVQALVRTLAARGFDGAVLFNVFSQNPLPAALVCYLAGIPARLGYCRENPYGLLTDWVPDEEPFGGVAHEVERQLKLVGTIGARTDDDRLSLAVPPDARQRTRERLAALGLAAGQFVVLHPGVSEAKRQCPLSVLAEAARELVQRGHSLVVTGTAAERVLAEAVVDAAGPGAVSLAGQLALDELSAVIAEAAVLIVNNTGPAHIAAATSTPVVVVYALTNPQHTPWRAQSRVLYFDVPPDRRSRSPLLRWMYDTMQKETPPRVLGPDEIVRAAEDLMAGAPVEAEAAGTGAGIDAGRTA